MNLHRRHLKEGQRQMIAARWADAEVGRPVNTAHTQDYEETTVTEASKALKVGERGIYHAKVVLSKGTPEEIAIPKAKELVVYLAFLK